jgi:thymidylate synthase
MSTPSEEIWDLLRDVIRVQRANAEQFQDTDRKFQETDRRFQDTDRQIKELTTATDRQLKELGKQIGGLGEKFGSFTEGLALPSMERLLRERFGMEVVSPSVRVTKGGRHLEIDTLAYANGEINAAYVVEVKSHLREEAIDQLSTLLEQFRDFFPEHRDKRLYGILAAVDASPALRERALRKGFYVARIHDAVFELDVPEGFQPRVF